MIYWHEFSLAATGLAEPAWLRLVGLLAATWAGIWALRPVATLLHELGHAIPALFFTSEVVELQVGKDAQKRKSGDAGGKVKETVIWRSLGRLRWACSFRGSFQGFTGYDRDALSWRALLLVIAGGPFVSGLAVGLGAWLCFEVFEDIWQRVAAVAFLCSNAILLLRSVIPIRMRDGEPSDGLDFWRSSRKANK